MDHSLGQLDCQADLSWYSVPTPMDALTSDWDTFLSGHALSSIPFDLNLIESNTLLPLVNQQDIWPQQEYVPPKSLMNSITVAADAAPCTPNKHDLRGPIAISRPADQRDVQPALREHTPESAEAITPRLEVGTPIEDKPLSPNPGGTRLPSTGCNRPELIQSRSRTSRKGRKEALGIQPVGGRACIQRSSGPKSRGGLLEHDLSTVTTRPQYNRDAAVEIGKMRCLCSKMGFNIKDDYMIQCDKCKKLHYSSCIQPTQHRHSNGICKVCANRLTILATELHRRRRSNRKQRLYLREM
ncbi:hypothetical protein B0T10DRAFT_141182 [Thelonectria olida]|uniref:Uncharacterized protein n=1 Tax=Thelonectria olida TaxID=1576542 RepID=A0A9P8VZV8_9HYPO|nr:hypothetical protein B0T10DRAFT_141182 [Thelonectria olida]